LVPLDIFAVDSGDFTDVELSDLSGVPLAASELPDMQPTSSNSVVEEICGDNWTVVVEASDGQSQDGPHIERANPIAGELNSSPAAHLACTTLTQVGEVDEW
jgi:hypothetical protein